MQRQLLLLLTGILLFGVLPAQTPTLWRGPQGDGIYREETGLLKVWPENGPEVLWHYDSLGIGFSSPALANNKIYLTGMVDSIGYLFVLDRNGSLQYKLPYGKEWTISYGGARSTPTIAGHRIYVYSGHGLITCFNDNTRGVEWTMNVIDQLGGVNIKWGVTESLVVDGDMLYVSPGGPENNIVALNRYTGDLIWSTPARGDISGYCTPRIISLPKRKILVTMMSDYVVGVDAITGEYLWSHLHQNRWAVQANTILYADNRIVFFSGYGKGGGQLLVDDNGKLLKEVWFQEQFDSKMGGAVLLNGWLFGSGDKYRGWMAVDWKTGQQNFYDKESLAKGVVIAADGLLYCYSEKGELALVNPDPERLDIISQTKVEFGTEQHWAHPVIDKGILFVRHGNALIAYKIK